MTSTRTQQSYKIVEFNMDLMSVEQCSSAGQMIDSFLRQGENNLILRFAKGIKISGSFTGFLMERVKKIRKQKGQIAIIAAEKETQGLLEEFSIHRLVPVFPSLRSFGLSSECKFPLNNEADSVSKDPIEEKASLKKIEEESGHAIAQTHDGNHLSLDGNDLGATEGHEYILPVLSKAIQESGARVVVLDISGLKGIFSKGIRTIVALHRQCREQNRQFVVTYAKGNAWTTLRSQRLDARIHFREKAETVAASDFVDSPFAHVVEKSTRLFHPICPECRQDDLVYNHDRGFKWMRRLLVLNSRFVCARCRITWRRKRPDAFLDFVVTNSDGRKLENRKNRITSRKSEKPGVSGPTRIGDK